MISINAVYSLMEQKESNGLHKEFSFAYVSKSTGEIIRSDKAICTSSHFSSRTINVKFLNSGEIRKLRNVLMIEFNEQPIIL